MRLLLLLCLLFVSCEDYEFREEGCFESKYSEYGLVGVFDKGNAFFYVAYPIYGSNKNKLFGAPNYMGILKNNYIKVSCSELMFYNSSVKDEYKERRILDDIVRVVKENQ